MTGLGLCLAIFLAAEDPGPAPASGCGAAALGWTQDSSAFVWQFSRALAPPVGPVLGATVVSGSTGESVVYITQPRVPDPNAAAALATAHLPAPNADAFAAWQTQHPVTKAISERVLPQGLVDVATATAAGDWQNNSFVLQKSADGQKVDLLVGPRVTGVWHLPAAQGGSLTPYASPDGLRIAWFFCSVGLPAEVRMVPAIGPRVELAVPLKFPLEALRYASESLENAGFVPVGQVQDAEPRLLSVVTIADAVAPQLNGGKNMASLFLSFPGGVDLRPGKLTPGMEVRVSLGDFAVVPGHGIPPLVGCDARETASKYAQLRDLWSLGSDLRATMTARQTTLTEAMYKSQGFKSLAKRLKQPLQAAACTPTDAPESAAVEPCLRPLAVDCGGGEPEVDWRYFRSFKRSAEETLFLLTSQTLLGSHPAGFFYGCCDRPGCSASCLGFADPVFATQDSLNALVKLALSDTAFGKAAMEALRASQRALEAAKCTDSHAQLSGDSIALVVSKLGQAKGQLSAKTARERQIVTIIDGLTKKLQHGLPTLACDAN